MKRVIRISMFLGMVFLFSGCSSLLGLTSDNPLETTSNQQNTTETVTQGEITIDYDELLDDVQQEVYDQIYSDLYNEIKDQIIEDISDEEVEAIYQSVRTELLEKLAEGDLDIESRTIFDQVITLGKTAAKAVVGVNNLNANNEVVSTGSGVIYKRDGNQYYVVTNHHVIEDADHIQIQFSDEGKQNVELLGVETLVDIAVLKFTSTKVYQTASFGNSDELQKGEFITAVGNPSGFTYFNTMTFGVVSGLNRYFDIDEDGIRDMFVNYIQHDAAINAGNSGGALFNMYGEIVGINTLKLVDYTIEGMGFAIPSNLVALIAGDIEDHGYSNRKPILGISFVDISSNRDNLILDGKIIPDSIEEGFYIQSVVEGSTTDGYLLANDIVVKIGDIEIESTNQFVMEFSQYLIGDVIDIVVYRNGEYITIQNIELKGRE